MELLNSLEFWVMLSFAAMLLLGFWRAFVIWKRVPSQLDIPVTDAIEDFQEYAKQRAFEIRAKKEQELHKIEEQNKGIGHA